MHVNTRKMAVSGLLMAFAVVLIILSGILDFNTLFFLAAAAFLIGPGRAAGTSETLLHYLRYDGDLCAGCGISLAFPGESSRLEEPQTAADPWKTDHF